MTKTVKVSLTIPEDIILAAKEQSPDSTLSSAISNLLRQALNGGCVEASGPVPQDESILQRIKKLEDDMNKFRDQIVQEFRDVKLSFITEKARISPKKRVRGVNHGYVSLEGEILRNVLNQFELMQAAGLTQREISPIMGLKGNTIVSHVRGGIRKSLSQQAYDALMAWSP